MLRHQIMRPLTILIVKLCAQLIITQYTQAFKMCYLAHTQHTFIGRTMQSFLHTTQFLSTIAVTVSEWKLTKLTAWPVSLNLLNCWTSWKTGLECASIWHSFWNHLFFNNLFWPYVDVDSFVAIALLKEVIILFHRNLIFQAGQVYFYFKCMRSQSEFRRSNGQYR